MANGIVAAPFGKYGQFLPYFSAGIGVFHMSTNFVTLDPANSLTGGQGRFGGNIGGGFIGYAGNVGVRGDVRWYNVDVERDFTASNARDVFTLGLLSGLEVLAGERRRGLPVVTLRSRQVVTAIAIA